MTEPEPTIDPDLPPAAQQRLFSPVTATLICGQRDAILVDALLTLDQARRLADWIAGHGKNLTSVYITHAALKPDVSVAAATDILWFYFGYYSYLTLTDENGWTLADAEKWLFGQASSALLP